MCGVPLAGREVSSQQTLGLASGSDDCVLSGYLAWQTHWERDKDPALQVLSRGQLPPVAESLMPGVCEEALEAQQRHRQHVENHPSHLGTLPSEYIPVEVSTRGHLWLPQGAVEATQPSASIPFGGLCRELRAVWGL